MSFVVGVAAAAPVVFSDFIAGKTLTLTPDQISAFSFFYAVGSVLQYTALIDFPLLTPVVVGVDQVWVALFGQAAPAGADPVLAASGPFDVAP